MPDRQRRSMNRKGRMSQTDAGRRSPTVEISERAVPGTETRSRCKYRRSRWWISKAVLGPIAVAASLVSCAEDKTCTSQAYDSKNTTLDSLAWMVGPDDSTVARGSAADSGEDRVRNWLGNGWDGWDPMVLPNLHAYVSNLTGTLVVGGRLGRPDTVVFYDLDSVGVRAEDDRTATVRMRFRSVLRRAETPYSVGSEVGRSTYWTLRGRAECTFPLDSALAIGSSSSCRIAAAESDGLAYGMTFQVVKNGPSEYSCDGLTTP